MTKLSESYLNLKEILISSQKNQNYYRIPVNFCRKKEKKLTVILCFSIRLVRFGNN